ncbi:MAG: RNA pseudouridine synthase, partial [Mesorhizobium sp.]
MLRQDELPGDELDGAVELEAGADAAGKRLDQWLTAQLGPEISRSRVQALIKQGAVTIAGKPVEEAKRKMAPGERVAVIMPEPEPAEPQGEAIPLDILYEDDELIVVNKPAGLVVHPGAGNWTGTLVNALI